MRADRSAEAPVRGNAGRDAAIPACRSGIVGYMIKKAFIRADSWLLEILAKFRVYVKD